MKITDLPSAPVITQGAVLAHSLVNVLNHIEAQIEVYAGPPPSLPQLEEFLAGAVEATARVRARANATAGIEPADPQPAARKGSRNQGAA